MSKIYHYLLALGVAAASLSSCSSSHYAFNGRTPAYLGAQPIASAVAPSTEVTAAEVVTASTTDDLASLAATSTPAHQAAAALAHRTVAPRPSRTAPSAVAASTVAAPKETAVTAVSRKAFKQEVKRQLAASKGVSAEGKSQVVAALLCFFLGGLGIHDFYLGYVGKGILQIFLSLILVGFILVIIDFVRILTGSLKPKGGEYEKKL